MKDVPYLNPDPCCWFIGPKNLDEALIDGELVTCLLDNGAQLNFITPAYACKQGMDIMSLDSLAQEVGGKIPPILGIGGIMAYPEGFVMMNVQIPYVKGYNEDQIVIMMDDPGLKDCLVILGTPTPTSNGGNQGKRNLQVGCTIGLLKSLLVDKKHACSNEPVGC